MAKSWFYLTLWRGTPKDFTTEYDVEIDESKDSSAVIKKTDKVTAKLSRADKAYAEIYTKDAIKRKVETSTEVVWYVGAH